MDEPMLRFRQLLKEFRRRSVYRVGAMYLAAAFVLLQGASLLLPARLIGDGTYRLLTFAAVLGFPLALALAWAFDITPDGIRRAEGGPPLSRALRWTLVVSVVIIIAGAGAAAWNIVPAGVDDADTGSRLPPSPADPSRIAVLYFDDHSPGRDLGYLADGLTEDLIRDLALSPVLSVASRNSVRQFRGGAVSTDSLRQLLDVGSYIGGSVTRSGDWIRVSAQLIDATSGMHLATHMIERPMRELFSLQDTLVEQVSQAIRQRLGLEVRARQRRSETNSLEAWTLVQRARELDSRMSSIWRDSPEAALATIAHVDSMLLTAARLDPDWHRPALLLGWNERRRAAFTSEIPGTLVQEPLALGLVHAETALRQSMEDRSEALELRGVLRFELSRLSSEEARDTLRRGAEADLRSATLDNPRLARAWWALSELLRETGRFDEARADAVRALQVDAYLEEAADIIQRLFHTAFEQRNHREARRWCDNGRGRFPTNQNFVICQLLIVATAADVPPDVALARALGDSLEWISAPADQPLYRAYSDMQLAKVFARRGERDSAHAAIARAHGAEFQAWLGYDEAHTRLMLGERVRALDLLDAYLELRPDRREYWPTDWWLETVWEDERFIAMIRAHP